MMIAEVVAVEEVAYTMTEAEVMVIAGMAEATMTKERVISLKIPRK